MRTEKLILLALTFLVAPIFIVTAGKDDNTFFSVTLEYNKGTITSEEVKLIQSVGDLDKKETIGDYTVKVYSFDEKILYETKFNFDFQILSAPPREWFDDEGNQIYIPNETEAGKITLDSVSKVIFIPYLRTGKSINIYDTTNRKILAVDISSFAVCNLNSVCDGQESKELCPEDCTVVKKKSLSFWKWLINLIKSFFG